MAFGFKSRQLPAWDDLGPIANHQYFDQKTGGFVAEWTSHTFCNTRVHIGRKDGKLIKFCPLCQVEVEKDVKPKNKPTRRKR